MSLFEQASVALSGEYARRMQALRRSQGMVAEIEEILAAIGTDERMIVSPIINTTYEGDFRGLISVSAGLDVFRQALDAAGLVIESEEIVKPAYAGIREYILIKLQGLDTEIHADIPADYRQLKVAA